MQGPGYLGEYTTRRKKEKGKERTVFLFTSLFVAYKERLKSTALGICRLGDWVDERLISGSRWWPHVGGLERTITTHSGADHVPYLSLTVSL